MLSRSCSRPTTCVISRFTVAAVALGRRGKHVGRRRDMVAELDTAPIGFEEDLGLRSFILKRRALDAKMMRQLKPQIDYWANSGLCATVVGRSAVDGVFGDGGDTLREVVKSVTGAEPSQEARTQALDHFRLEVELFNSFANLARAEKPYIALMDGLTVGSGLSLALPALFRVATERTTISMDTMTGAPLPVGASWLLSQLDGELGTWLATTGEVVNGREAYELGLATHYISSSSLPALLDSLASLDEQQPALVHVAHLLEEYSLRGSDQLWTPPPPQANTTSTLPTQHEDRPPTFGIRRVVLDATFTGENSGEIRSRLEDVRREGGLDDDTQAWTRRMGRQLEWLEARGPRAWALALTMVRRGAENNLSDALSEDWAARAAICQGKFPQLTRTESPKSDASIDPQTLARDLLTVPSDIPAPDLPRGAEDYDAMAFGMPTERHIRALLAQAEAPVHDFELSELHGSSPEWHVKLLDMLARNYEVSDDRVIRWPEDVDEDVDEDMRAEEVGAVEKDVDENGEKEGIAPDEQAVKAGEIPAKSRTGAPSGEMGDRAHQSKMDLEGDVDAAHVKESVASP